MHSHAFSLILKQVDEFRGLSAGILGLQTRAYFTMICLDCGELKLGLANKAKSYAELLLNKLATSHREQNLQLVTFI